MFLIKNIFCLSILYLNYGNKDTALSVYLVSARHTPSQQLNTSRQAATTSQQLRSTTVSALTLCRKQWNFQRISTANTVPIRFQYSTLRLQLQLLSASSTARHLLQCFQLQFPIAISSSHLHHLHHLHHLFSAHQAHTIQLCVRFLFENVKAHKAHNVKTCAVSIRKVRNTLCLKLWFYKLQILCNYLHQNANHQYRHEIAIIKKLWNFDFINSSNFNIISRL